MYTRAHPDTHLHTHRCTIHTHVHPHTNISKENVYERGYCPRPHSSHKVREVITASPLLLEASLPLPHFYKVTGKEPQNSICPLKSIPKKEAESLTPAWSRLFLKPHTPTLSSLTPRPSQGHHTCGPLILIQKKPEKPAPCLGSHSKAG